jgi:hypothetical protein
MEEENKAVPPRVPPLDWSQFSSKSMTSYSGKTDLGRDSSISLDRLSLSNEETELSVDSILYRRIKTNEEILRIDQEIKECQKLKKGWMNADQANRFNRLFERLQVLNSQSRTEGEFLRSNILKLLETKNIYIPTNCTVQKKVGMKTVHDFEIGKISEDDEKIVGFSMKPIREIPIAANSEEQVYELVRFESDRLFGTALYRLCLRSSEHSNEFLSNASEKEVLSEVCTIPIPGRSYVFVTLASGAILVRLATKGGHVEILEAVSECCRLPSDGLIERSRLRAVVFARYAGEIYFLEEGQIDKWNAQSGTYTPDHGNPQSEVVHQGSRVSSPRQKNRDYSRQALQANLPESAFDGL